MDHRSDDWLHDMIYKLENGARKLSISKDGEKWVTSLNAAKKARLVSLLKFALSCPVSEHKPEAPTHD